MTGFRLRRRPSLTRRPCVPSAGTGTMVSRAWSEAPIDSGAGRGEGINQGEGGPGLGAGEVGVSQNDPPKLEAFLTPPIEPVLAPKHK